MCVCVCVGSIKCLTKATEGKKGVLGCSPREHSHGGGEGVVAGVHSQEAKRDRSSCSCNGAAPCIHRLFPHRHTGRSVSMVILDPLQLGISSYRRRFDLLKHGQVVIKGS